MVERTCGTIFCGINYTFGRGKRKIIRKRHNVQIIIIIPGMRIQDRSRVYPFRCYYSSIGVAG